MFLRQIMVSLALIFLIVQPIATMAKDEAPNGLVDDSIRDMTIVFGTGAAGAVLGLSTLSFVDEPSKHMKNVAIGGAIGIVIGVAAVVFYQASKTSSYQAQTVLPISAEQFASISKVEFRESHQEIKLPNQNEALRILLPF